MTAPGTPETAPTALDALGGVEGEVGARVFVVLLPVLDLLNANQRLHWRVRDKRIATIRSTAKIVARSMGIPPLQRAHIFGLYLPADARRRDPANWAPSAKAATDGLVDAAVLPDDDHKHLIGPDMRLGSRAPLVLGRRHGRLMLRILELPTGPDCHQAPIPREDNP